MVTSQFIHADMIHILGNMFIFFFVGAALEERIGFKKFLAIYILSGIGAGLAHSLIGQLDIPYFGGLLPNIPSVGASGAIFGIMGALAYSYSDDEVLMPIPAGFIMLIRRIKVLYAVILFSAIETAIIIYRSLNPSGIADNTAHFAHIGGLISGVILAAILVGRSRTHHEKTGKTIYYDSSYQRKPKTIDLKSLEELAKTPDLKEMLQRIKSENVPQVRDIWIDHFLERAICPKCGKKLSHFDKEIWCDKCGYKKKY